VIFAKFSRAFRPAQTGDRQVRMERSRFARKAGGAALSFNRALKCQQAVDLRPDPQDIRPATWWERAGA
jgi:hypothetical protein